MNELHAANDKLREAEFFFHLMEHHQNEYEFKYLLSAFLSALSSCTEHNRLQSSDPRFKDWYRGVSGKYIEPSEIPRLAKLRNREIHHKGTEALQRVGFATAEENPMTTTQVVFTMDFSKGDPTGTYKTAEMAESAPLELTCDWVWNSEGSPNVMALCAAGLDAARSIIADRDSMNFSD